jgi:tRNA(fMet)-specific endonuclease VapC
LEKSGTTIGPYDLLIAGQALARGLTVVTANASEFARVQGLGWVDWTR